MELIKIYNGKLVDARELHAFLGSKRDFSNWITQRIQKYGFEDGKDFSTNLLKSQGGRPSKEYYLTLDMAKELAMVENNAKGREARQYFITAEETLKKLAEDKRLTAFMKLENTKEKLLQEVKKIGGGHEEYLQIDLAGRTVFFNGKPLADEEISTLLLKGRDLATEMTNIKLGSGGFDIEGAEELNKMNHEGARKYIIDGIGITPEDIKKERNIRGKDGKELIGE